MPTPPRGVGKGYALVFTAVIALYLATMAPGVLWQDNGLAQVRTLQRDIYGDLGLALSHPLYYVLTITFQHIPFGESAFRTNLVAVLFGAVTVANVFLLLRVLTGRIAPALVGAISLAVAHTFWQQCVMAEVYSVSSALLTAELLCFFQYSRTQRPIWLILLFFCNGLGISNHMMAVLSLACYFLLTIRLLMTRRLKVNVVPLVAASWLFGAGLYLGMIVSQIVDGSGLSTVIHSALFGSAYSRQVLNLSIRGGLLKNTVLYIGLNFPTPLFLLVLSAVASLRNCKCADIRKLIAALLAVHMIWAMRYNVPDQYTFFFLSVVLWAIVIGLGADRFLGPNPSRWNHVLIVAAALPVLVYLPLPRVTRALHLNLGLAREVPCRDSYTYFLHPWKTGYRGAERFVSELRNSLQDGSVLIADSTTVRPLHYAQLTGRWNPAVRVFPPIEAADGSEFTPAMVREELATWRVYVVSIEPGYCPDWLLRHYEFCRDGLVYRVCGVRSSATQPIGVPSTRP